MPFYENNSNGLIYMTAPGFGATHAFTTRYSGVSGGVYESLNLGMRLGDDASNVSENYDRLCLALGIKRESIVYSNQVHGADIRVVSRGERGRLFLTNSNQADGLITNEAGVTLTIFTADCTPILLYDPVRRAIGAVHAGWRGTVANIAGAAVKRMAEEYGCSPPDIKAVIGPCISKCCYTVGREVADAIYNALYDGIIAAVNDATISGAAKNAKTSSCRNMADCVTGQNGGFMVDLKEINRLLLIRAGLADVTVSEECTSCRSGKYWSHRATGGKRGSQAALICLED